MALLAFVVLGTVSALWRNPLFIRMTPVGELEIALLAALSLRPKLWRELKPGTRVVSYAHSMGDWTPHEARNVEGATARGSSFSGSFPAIDRRQQGAYLNGT